MSVGIGPVPRRYASYCGLNVLLRRDSGKGKSICRRKDALGGGGSGFLRENGMGAPP
jgi:hypothetical protein